MEIATIFSSSLSFINSHTLTVIRYNMDKSSKTLRRIEKLRAMGSVVVVAVMKKLIQIRVFIQVPEEKKIV